MTGLLIRPNGKRFIVRKHDDQWLGWDIYSQPSRGRTDKWKKLPSGDFIRFDIDDPPATVSYQPILSPFV